MPSNGWYGVGAIASQSQFASPRLADAILRGQVLAVDDPNWSESGFHTREQYAFWSMRLCSIACVKMVLNEWSPGAAPTMAALTDEAVRLGAYPRDPLTGDWLSRGWMYDPLLEVCRQHGVGGAVHRRLSATELARLVCLGSCLMASVDRQVLSGHTVQSERGGVGHSVLLTGCRVEAGQPYSLMLNDPASTQQVGGAVVSFQAFRSAFGGRGIEFHPEQIRRADWLPLVSP